MGRVEGDVKMKTYILWWLVLATVHCSGPMKVVITITLSDAITESAFLGKVAKVLEMTRQEDGCLVTNLHKERSPTITNNGKTEPPKNRFVLISSWKTPAAFFYEHLKKKYVKEFIK